MRRLALFALIASVLGGAEPRFVGVLVGPQDSLFCVVPGAGGPARWIGLGQTCDGYKLVCYLPDQQALVVENASVRTVWFLPAAKTGELPPDPWELTAIAKREVRNREGWDDRVRAAAAQPDGQAYRVLVRENAGGFLGQTRTVILSKHGEIEAYWKG